MEQTADHRTCQIHSLVADVVSVLLLVAIQRAVQQLVHHIAQVERLLAVAVGAEVHVDVRQHDLLQETTRKLDSLGPRPRSVLIDHFGMARRDEVQRFLRVIAFSQHPPRAFCTPMPPRAKAGTAPSSPHRQSSTRSTGSSRPT